MSIKANIPHIRASRDCKSTESKACGSSLDFIERARFWAYTVLKALSIAALQTWRRGD
jgi:hypothetical protein